ncbi:MAG: DUF47 domain-containing protein [Nitrososphaeria archaeon]
MYLGEPEIQAKRKILAVLTDESRKTIDAIRELAKMTAEGAADESYIKIQSIADDIKGYRRALTRSLAELGSMIINKEDIMRVAYQIEELVDLVEGTAFRLKQFNSGKYSKYDIMDTVSKITDKLIEMVIKLNDMIKMLQINPEKISDMLPAIENIEKEIDGIYRQSLIDAYDSINDPKLYVLVKDILERLDKISDLILSLSDSVMVVSIGL